MDKKKTAAAAAVTVAAAAGMVTGALFDTPADLMAETAPDAVTEQLADEDAGAPEEKRQSAAVRLRQWVLRLPAGVRMLVGVPLWALGWVLLTGLSALWAGVGPIAAHGLRWLCLTLVVLMVFALSVKAAFPKLPVRRILRPRNVLFLLGAALLLAAADLALPMVWHP